MNFANRLVAPIRRLIGAANIVSTGNLYVQVPMPRSEGDLAQLGETFNQMTYELRTQRDDIVRARDLIDQRRRFTEAVLAGASAGVIGVDGEGRISILNRSAEKLIDRPEADVIGQPLSEIVPELKEIFATAQSGIQRLVQGQVTINRQNRERNLSVRVTTEQSADSEHGYVITLDDITELVTAQRTSAWADIARRIAHEIKNPLTPIQLSAERLRRKYGKSITDDPAVFYQCTDTIVRQVDDIKRMVDEFSKFARMPKAVIAAEDVADTVRQVVFLMRVGNADIDIDLELAEDPMPARFDRRLISQALTNIIKNATEAIAAVPQSRARPRPHPRDRRARGRRHRHRRDRQRHRPAEGKPQPAARALCHHAREGHRPRPRHRRPHPRRAWRRHRAARRLGEIPGRARRLDAAALHRRAAATRRESAKPRASRRTSRSRQRALRRSEY